MAWTKVAKAGTHTAMSGKEVTLSEADLDEIVATLDPKELEPPLVLGHPKNNDPAYGWVKALKREGEDLFAQFAQVPDSLKGAVDNGHYKYKSVSLYPGRPLRLRHVGLLGAVPPAIKGLGPVQFGEGDAPDSLIIDLSETPGNPPASKPEPSGKEAPVDPKDKRIKELEAEKAALQKEKDDAAKARADAEDKAKQADEAKAKAEASFAESAARQAKADREARFDKLVKSGKALPAEKDRIMAFCEQLEDKTEELSFSEGEGKKPLAEHFWGFLESRDSHGLFNEFSEPADDTTGDAGGYHDLTDCV